MKALGVIPSCWEVVQTDASLIGISYQSSGRPEVQLLAEVDMGPFDVGFPSTCKHQSNVCVGGFEYGGRFIVPSQTKWSDSEV